MVNSALLRLLGNQITLLGDSGPVGPKVVNSYIFFSVCEQDSLSCPSLTGTSALAEISSTDNRRIYTQFSISCFKFTCKILPLKVYMQVG